MAEPDNEFDAPEIWDEYQWERFLQQQDRTTEKYFQLMEQYLDHPDRDRLIAQEMGWSLAMESEEDFSADAFMDQLEEENDSESEPTDEEYERFARSPIYQDTLKLHRWIHQWMEKRPDLQEDENAIRLATQAAIAGAKLAAALCGQEDAELGMTIAYLKRGLKAMNEALEAGANLGREGLLPPRRLASLNQRLFRVRNQIVDLMRAYRIEWKNRYGDA
ncbi:MAG TPA: hypothetical protein VIS74_05550 [Chthoniobacterales bacterium]